MKLDYFPEVTTTFAKDQSQYRDLPAYRYQDDDQGRIVFCWKLSWKERIIVLLSGRLWHQVLTFKLPLQPQMLGVDKPVMPPHTK